MEIRSPNSDGRFDVPALKKRLIGYTDLEREIDNQIERLENIESKMYSIGSPELSDMPKASTVVGDRIGNMVAKKSELEETVRELVKRQSEERAWIQETLRHIKKADERAVIQMRYIDSESWQRVSYMLFGCNEDYPQREESYLRRTTKLHGRALVNMVNYLNSKKRTA